MQQLESTFLTLKADLKEYAALQIRQAKFEINEVIAEERAKIYLKALVFSMVFLLAIFASIFAALYLNTVFNSAFLGFGFVSVAWIVILIFMLLFRKQLKQYFVDDYLTNHIPS